MSKVPNKQSLLGKTPTRKKTTQKSKHQPTPVKPKQTINNPASTNNSDHVSKSKKGLLVTLGIITVIILAFPKPTLLTYKKLGMVSESIYWPGVFGYGAVIVDSNLYPQFDSNRKSLYLCSDLKKPQSCSKVSSNSR